MNLLTSLFRAAGIVFMTRVAVLTFNITKKNVNASKSYVTLRSYFTMDKVIGVLLGGFILTTLFPATTAAVAFIFNCYYIGSLINLYCFHCHDA